MTKTARALEFMRAAAACGAVAAALLSAGCASTESRGASPDRVTESDETGTQSRARIRLELALAYFEQGKTEIALDNLKQALAIDPTLPAAYNLRGLIYMRLNDNRLAEESFRRAMVIDPKDPDAHHNLGWLLCQQARYPEAQRSFELVLANPTYTGRARTLMAQGVCYARAGQLPEAEKALARAYELDPGNPVASYNFASLLYRRGENTRAQFVIRQLNNSELANAESLWLGIKVERRLNDGLAMRQLGEVLKKRFASSREAAAFERGAYDE